MSAGPCYDFLRGACSRGGTCKYSHTTSGGHAAAGGGSHGAPAAGPGNAHAAGRAAVFAELKVACAKLWELDENRLVPGRDYDIQLQAGKSAYSSGDFAALPLFKFVAPTALTKPTYQALIRLFDNYERQTGRAEVVTASERKENWDFLAAIMQTRVMKYVHELLVSKGLAAKSPVDFQRELHEMWFSMYKREALNDSSGFEHVFVGEERDGKIMGMHNWLQLYSEEKKGFFNYKGYIQPKRRPRAETPHEHEHLVTMQFEWGGKLKPVSTSFIGTSPEFEFGLYTLCFLMGGEVQRIEVGEYQDIDIRCFTFGFGGKRRIGTSYPEHEM